MKSPLESQQSFECELAAHVASFAPILPLAPSRLALLAERVSKRGANSPRDPNGLFHGCMIVGIASSVGLDPVHFLDALEVALAKQHEIVTRYRERVLERLDDIAKSNYSASLGGVWL